MQSAGMGPPNKPCKARHRITSSSVVAAPNMADANVNIATFNLGRESEGEEAIALVGVDSDVPDATLKAICDMPHVRYAKVLDF